MPASTSAPLDQAFSMLRQFARVRRPMERCELCSLPLAHEHPHLIELSSRQIVCACDACATLFDSMTEGRYRRAARCAKLLTDFEMTDAQWNSLLIPINMAFFFRSSIENRMVPLYPSPAGAVESLLSLEAWNEIVERNAILSHLRSDIEALLVNRIGHAQDLSSAEYYIAPIDDCYRLVGLIRANWKGLSGGAEVWMEIGRFFADLKSRADVVGGEAHA
ncbi:hypothetical protein H7849_13230 [Alloacidobacterium dinghuense]|uniref:Uncharacterized protein n=1 Tax=Alloacidobacterium dinghuense TaxID=2763107 RepID=A0A7G8BC88_9BACT|nr:DUF5947 family protein [Alloacidobacterium dinghuense]QNI30158.1 hypothetical protein H7849_13230 [Alloacidobacterium dinghuense]